MPRELEGLVAAVTGGGSGIGLATVRLLAACGARVAALDLDPVAAGEPVEGAERPLPLVADVTDEASVGAAVAAVVELVLIRPLYNRHIEQVLVTVGLALAATALVQAIWGGDQRPFVTPPWLNETTTVFGAHIPNDRWLEIATAGVVLGLLQLFLRRTRYGLIIRAGVENRAMVQALGIDVRKAFTFVFAVGGIAAALAGALSNVYFGSVTPDRGTNLLIFAFIVVVIGGLGSIGGSAVAAVVVGLAQQYANYYGSSGMGDIVVVMLLGLVLLVRPRGLAGAFAT